MNPYLKAKRDQYESLRSAIDGMQSRATEEKRDLKEDELRSISEQGAQAETLYKEIESLTAIETRNQKVAKLAAEVTGSDGDGDPDRKPEGEQQHDRGAGEQKPGGHKPVGGSATAKDRDPGHYRSEKGGGKNSFFGDLLRAKEGDGEAGTRLVEHNRALSTGGQGAGVLPPKWLGEEYAALPHQGRRLAQAVRQIDLGQDPRPILMPKQTGGALVAEQPAENDPVLETDAFDTEFDTVAPKATAGKQIVSRQMLDMSSPAVDLLIYSDLMADYDEKVERKVALAMLAAAGAAVVTLAGNTEFDADLGECLIDAGLAVYSDRHLPADIAIMNIARWGRFKKLKDTTNRPLIPSGSGGPMNVIGVGDVAVDGQVHDLGVVATVGIPSTYPEAILVARAADTLLFESAIMRFRYEEPKGPESIILGVWGYTAVYVKHAGLSVKRVTVTAAV